MRIYVAGPYTQGDPVLNLRNALEAAEEIAAQGHAPYVPHLTMFWHLVFPHGNQHWYDHDLAWLDVCEGHRASPRPVLRRRPGGETGGRARAHDLRRRRRGATRMDGHPIYTVRQR